MVLENVVIEISKHRDIGTVYLTNYRYIPIGLIYDSTILVIVTFN
jgi:DNA integrity scanning protein DisA with diadenylate cyclase activity